MCNRMPMLHALLEHGAAPDVANRWGFTPVMWAKWLDHTSVIDLLVKRGASLTTKDEGGLANLQRVRRDDPDVGNLLKWEGSALLPCRRRRRQRTEMADEESGLQSRMEGNVNSTVAAATLHLQEPRQTLDDTLKSLVDIPRKPDEESATRKELQDVLANAHIIVANVVASGSEVAPRDIFAMHVYTVENPPFYYVVNRAVRLPEETEEEKALKVQSIAEFNDIIFHLQASFRRLHSSGAFKTVYRGVKKEFINLSLYQPGTVVTWPAFSSTSLSLTVASGFAESGVVFVIAGSHDSVSAKNIAIFSQFPEEEELLYGPNTAFTVKCIFGFSMGTLKVILECANSGSDPTRYIPPLNVEQASDHTAVIVYLTEEKVE